MIIWLLFLLCPFSLHGIIIQGYALTSSSGSKVSALGDLHPSHGYIPPQDRVRNQVEICREFARRQSREKTVFLVEEVSPSIAKIYDEINEASILNDMRKVAESTGLEYKNIDLRSATIAAQHVFHRYRRKEKIDKTLSFGPSPDEMKKPSFVTLDDLFAEKERYIDNMRNFSWLEDEQERADRLHKALSISLQGCDVSMTVRKFCKKNSDVVCDQFFHAMEGLSFYLFDTYAKKVVLDYAENRHYGVLLVAGFKHIFNIKDQLDQGHNWDYCCYLNGEGLSEHELRSTLRIDTPVADKSVYGVKELQPIMAQHY